MHFSLLLLVVAIGIIDGKRQCWKGCSVSAYMGVPLTIPDRRCNSSSGDYCQVKVWANYHDNTYSVDFDTSFVSGYSRFIYILTSNYLSYSATYSCSDNDLCALDFAKKKVLDLSNRTYNAFRIGAELSPLLNELRPVGSGLVCYDNDACTGGICEIEYDTKSNSQRKRGCNREDVPARVSAYDSGSYASLDVNCNRTQCNSPDIIREVKVILARYNLTDANGRINGASVTMVPLILVGVLALFSIFIR